MSWLDDLVTNYYNWLKNNTTIITASNNEWSVIDTPFLGLFNDTIELYAKKSNGNILLSDDGTTIHNLKLNGVTFSRSSKRKELLDRILLNYGIKLNNEEELCVDAEERNFAQKKHNLISAISEINDFYLLAKHTISSIFKEDVKEYLDSQEIIYTPQFISRGSIDIEFVFDFQIAYKNKEIVIKSFNNLNKMNLPHFIYTWNDIKKVRERITNKSFMGLAIINDEDKEVKSEYLNALKSEGADFILWKERYNKENLNKLAA